MNFLKLLFVSGALLNLGLARSQTDASHWFFGNNAYIDFSNGVAVSNGPLSTDEGTATISDLNGNLILYTDGTTVWNSNNLQIGTGLLGDVSATQSALIVPRPQSSTQFYVFTVGTIANGNPDLNYTLVDMTLNGGNGGFVNGQVNVLLASNIDEKLTGVEICDESGYWVLVHENNSNTFHAFEVTASGVNSVPTSSNVGIIHNSNASTLNTVGYMKFSPNGDEIALVYRGTNQTTVNGGAYRYSFNSSSSLNGGGGVSNEIFVPGTGAISSLYGIEYSPSSNFLYIGDLTDVYRADLIGGTPATIMQTQGSFSSPDVIRALQLAPDGNIYVAVRNVNPAIISNPNLATSLLTANALNLDPNTNCVFGLPNFIQSNFETQDLSTSFQLSSCGEVSFQASSSANGQLNWEWNFGDGEVSNIQNPTHIYSDNGVSYTVTLTLTVVNGPCQETQIETFEITPDFGGCCLAENSIDYFTWTSPITDNTIWTGKIYIPDNTIITVSGSAILDITNVDVVFGECSGIYFSEGSMLRSNNSVFRPCSIHDTWQGLVFEGSSVNGHIINESTFKNAEIALSFRNQSTGTVSENLFANCNQGVMINAVDNFDLPINGNRFVIDNFYPQGVFCNSPSASPWQHATGISSFNSDISSEIAQNEFVNSNLELTAMFGIDLVGCSATISENLFTNVRNCIMVNDPKNSTYIQNNEIEYNSNFTFVDVTPNTPAGGISIMNANGPYVEVSGNEIFATSEDPQYAIYGDNVTNCNINANYIRNFSEGIYVRNTFSMKIADNVLEQVKDFGIVLLPDGDEFINSYISCNDLTSKVSRTAVGIWVIDGNERVYIHSNCVKDFENSIFAMEMINPITNLPNIRNNFLYNYHVGVRVEGHNGNIGTNGDPGLNTLWSNDISAIDVSSVGGSITVADNFGLNNISPPPSVTVTSNNPSHSTASCASQIYGTTTQGNLNDTYTCDPAPSIGPMLMDMGPSNVEKLISKIESSQNPSTVIQIAISTFEWDKEEVEYLINSLNLTQADQAEIWYVYALNSNNYDEALDKLNSLNLTEAVQIEWNEVRKAILKSFRDFDLTPADVNLLESLIDHNSSVSNSAASALRVNGNYGFYHNHVDLSLIKSTEQDYISIENENLKFKVFPTITESIIKVELISGEEVSGTLTITSMEGKMMYTQNLSEHNTQLLEIDVQSFSSGVYIISHRDNFGSVAFQRFVKQ